MKRKYVLTLYSRFCEFRWQDELYIKLQFCLFQVRKVNLLANSVKSSYPHELNNVNARQNEIKELWNQVQTKAKERRSRLEDAVGQQIFMNSSKNLINWAADVQDTMKVEESVRDVATAEQLKKQHMELGEEIRTREDE